MGAPKRYFREQFRANKLTLKHDAASDFYLSCWQTGQSPVPLLCLRLILFLGCIGILVSSLVITGNFINLSLWLLYLTHWGVVMITVTSGLAFLVSAIATFNRSNDPDELPWHVTLYWAAYNITTPVAIFITVFYYSLLLGVDEDLPFGPVLDLFIHGINSVVMVCLLATARHPMHLFQFLYPFLFTVIYMVFTLIYYYAGGTNPHGGTEIYPVLNWADPGPTAVMMVISAVFLLIVHILVVCLTVLRDFISRKYVRKSDTVYIGH